MEISFKLAATSNQIIDSSDLKDITYVLFFYPRDNTPGCNMEMKAFQKNYESFSKLGIKIFGINPDSIESHEKVKSKFELSYELISDPENLVAKQLGIDKTNLLGQCKVGRNSFIFQNNKCIHEFKNIKLPGKHVEKVLNLLENI